MRTLWSLTKIATEAPAVPAQTAPAQPVAPTTAPAAPAAPTPAAPTPPQPAVRPVNTGLPAAPAQKDEAKIQEIMSGPVGKEMRQVVLAIAQKNGSAPEVKPKFDEWRLDINTKVALNRIAIQQLGGNQHAKDKWTEYVESMDKMGKMDREQHTGEEWGEKQQRQEDQLDEKVKPILSRILQLATDKIKNDPAKKMNSQYFTSGLTDLFFGNTMGRLKKWKELFIRAVQGGVTAAIPPSLQNVQTTGDDPKSKSKAIREEINRQLAEDGMPEVLSFLAQLVTSDDPEAQKFLDEIMKHNANRARIQQQRGSGISTTKYDGSGGTIDITNLQEIDPNADRREDLEKDDPMSGLDEGSIEDITEVCNTFMANPAYQPIVQKLMKSTKPLSTYKDKPFEEPHLPDSELNAKEGGFNARKIVEDAVRSSLGQKEGEEPRWVLFMHSQSSRIPAPPGKTDLVKFRDSNYPALRQLLKQWAAQGDPALGKWVESKAAIFVDDKNFKGSHFPTMIRQMDHLTKTVLNELARQKETAYRRWQESGAGTKGRDRYTTIAQRTAALNYKLNYALDQLRALQDGKIHSYTTKGGELAFRINNDDPKKKGRLVQIVNGKEEDLSDMAFSQLSRAIAPESWIPDYLKELAKTDPLLLQKTGNLYKAPGEQAAHEEECERTYRQGMTPDDRLAGYRKMMGNHLFEVLKQKPEYAQQLAGIQDPAQQRAKIIELAGHDLQAKSSGLAKAGGAKLISDILNGVGTELDFTPYPKSRKAPDGRGPSTGLVASISNALGIRGEQWYIRPPEYDPFNKDDRTNITTTLGNAIDSVLPVLLHKKRQSMHRGRHDGKKKFPWVDPKAMFYWISILNPYSQVAKGGIDIPKDATPEKREELEKKNEAIRRKTKLLYELVGTDRPLSERHDQGAIQGEIDKVTEQPDNYDDAKFPGHLPPTGKLYEHAPDSTPENPKYRRMHNIPKLKDVPLKKFDLDIKHFQKLVKNSPHPLSPEVEQKITENMGAAMAWLDKHVGQGHTVKSLMSDPVAVQTMKKVEDRIKGFLTEDQLKMFQQIVHARPRGKNEDWSPRMVPGPDGRPIQKFDKTRLGRFLRAWYEMDLIDNIRIARIRYASRTTPETFDGIIDRIADTAIRDMERLAPTYG